MKRGLDRAVTDHHEQVAESESSGVNWLSGLSYSQKFAVLILEHPRAAELDILTRLSYAVKLNLSLDPIKKHLSDTEKIPSINEPYRNGELLLLIHPSIATSLNNLAECLRAKGGCERAEPLHREALAIDKKALGDNHPDVAIDLNNLAGLLKSQGKIAEAKEIFEEALKIRRNVLGDRHPDVARSLWWLATIEKETNNRVDALLLGKQALDISERALGSSHPITQRYARFSNPFNITSYHCLLNPIGYITTLA